MAEIKSTRYASARRLLTSGLRPLADISLVMASPPTITDPVSDGANSTVLTGQTTSAGLFSSQDPTRVTTFGGLIDGTGRIKGLTRFTATQYQAHGNCVAFYTDADTVDFALRCAAGATNDSTRWLAVVTDPDGVRRRIFSADRVCAFNNMNYYKLAFGSTAAGGRLIELYLGEVANFGGINTPTGYSIWPADDIAAQPKIGAIWDSFGEGSMNDATLRIKLTAMDWFGAQFGVNNVIVNGVGSTGVIATNNGTMRSFAQRVSDGDMNVSQIGALDLLLAPGSVNDANTGLGGVATPSGDATVQAAYTAYIQALMVAQPNAIIVGMSQQFTSGFAAGLTRAAAYKAGFLAAANGDPRMIYIDQSVFQKAPDTGVLGADTVHPGAVFGSRHIGERLARAVKAALRANLA